MSICLVGKSCSGKDTVARELVKLGYGKILTYTTRPQRPSELDGVDYHFITENEFKDMIKNKEFLEWRSYQTEEGIWYYGSRLSDFYDYNRKKVVILTPDGLERLNDLFDSYISIYLTVKNSILKKRMKKRPNKKESKRRYKADKFMFDGKEDNFDYLVKNYDRPIKEVASVCKFFDETA